MIVLLRGQCPRTSSPSDTPSDSPVAVVGAHRQEARS
jgi:hypothetical protein